MVINKDGLITENEEQLDSILENTEELKKNENVVNISENDNFFLDSSTKAGVEQNSLKSNATKSKTSDTETQIGNGQVFASPNVLQQNDLQQSSLEPNGLPQNDLHQNDLEQKNETVETNCLALTVRKDYNLSIVKNTILTTFRFSWKIAFSTLILNILKLFL